MNQASPIRYRKPGWFTQHIFNKAVSLLTRAGVSVWGSRVLEVAGRNSGDPRRVPVNLLSLDDNQYLVSARGTGQWVRNVRAAGGQLDLLLGRTRSTGSPPSSPTTRSPGTACLPETMEGRGRRVLRRSLR